MDEILIYCILAVLGLMFGSFAGASVWRLRARQLVEDKAQGEDVDDKEYKKLLPLTRATVRSDRSRCLHCEHPLAWYDLVPLFSWLTLGGRCRYCRKKIGAFEPMMELGVAAFFVGSFLLWPMPIHTTVEVLGFVLWLLSGVLLAILFAYDLKWFLLPDVIVFPLIGVGAVLALIKVLTAPNVMGAIYSLIGSVIILSGLYYILYILPNKKLVLFGRVLYATTDKALVGFGDVKLGLALALLLADWQLAFIALFAANLIGCLVVIPGMIAGKLSRQSHVPFGPMLILGAVFAMFWGLPLIIAYFTMSI